VADHGAARHRQELATILENDRQRLHMAVAVGVDRAVDAYVDDVLPNGPLTERRALKEAGIKFVDGTWPGRAILGRYTRKLSELVGKQPATMVAEERPGPALELKGSPA